MASPDLPSLIRAELAGHAWWIIYIRYVCAVAVILCAIFLASALAGGATSLVKERLEAVRKAPTDPRARLELGIAYYEVDEYEFALAELVEAIKLNPENKDNLSARANFHLGNVLLALDRAALAANAYREALRLGWKGSDVYLALGDTLTGLGKFDDAIAQYLEALRMSPGAYEAHAGLGLALEATGRLVEAEAHYELYLRSAPATEDHGVEAIKQRLATLKERRKM